MSTAFGYHSESTSPARKRIIARSLEIIAAKEAEKLARATQAAHEALQREIAARHAQVADAIKKRRLRLLNRLEDAFRKMQYDRVTPRRGATMRAILREVCKASGMSADLIKGPARPRPVVKVRHEAMYRCVAETGVSLVQIGVFFKRDHTTIGHAVLAHCIRNGLAPPRNLTSAKYPSSNKRAGWRKARASELTDA